jgi:hypothetical protein
MGRSANRAGFSLAEIIVATMVLAVLGLAFTQLMLTQGRFSDQQNALRGARTVARQSMNVLLSELRMVQDSGFVDSATSDGKVLRVMVPYLYGITCDNITAGTDRTVASMLPVDSMQYKQAKYYGYAWRQSNGTYRRFRLDSTGGAVPTVASTSEDDECTNVSTGINAISVGSVTGLFLELFPQGATTAGDPVFLFQRVRYSFKASTSFPGYYGLYRYADNGTEEELVAPFDSTARFKYWKTGATASTAAPPALDSIRGIDVVLAGVSTYTPSGKTSPSVSTLVTSIFFKNVRTY